MQSPALHAMAMAVVMTAAPSPAASSWAKSEPRFRLAMPTALEETIYWRDCPSDEISSAWVACRVVGIDENCNRK